MSLDLERDYPMTNRRNNRPEPARCAFHGCTSAEYEIPIACESCGAFTCVAHRKEYEHYAFCRACEAKERTHISVAVLALLTVTLDAHVGKSSANCVAERLYFIADELEKWDFRKAEAREKKA